MLTSKNVATYVMPLCFVVFDEASFYGALLYFTLIYVDNQLFCSLISRPYSQQHNSKRACNAIVWVLFKMVEAHCIVCYTQYGGLLTASELTIYIYILTIMQ